MSIAHAAYYHRVTLSVVTFENVIIPVVPFANMWFHHLLIATRHLVQFSSRTSMAVHWRFFSGAQRAYVHFGKAAIVETPRTVERRAPFPPMIRRGKRKSKERISNSPNAMSRTERRPDTPLFSSPHRSNLVSLAFRLIDFEAPEYSYVLPLFAQRIPPRLHFRSPSPFVIIRAA